MNAIEKFMSSCKNKISSKHKYNKHVQKLQVLQSPFSIHFCFRLGTVKLCFVSQGVNRVDPQIVSVHKILNFWATIVIQIFFILSEKSGQQSTLFKSFSKHFCIQYLYVVKHSEEFIIIHLYTTLRNSM